jgi:ligand-binding sensor domain-containing protein
VATKPTEHRRTAFGQSRCLTLCAFLLATGNTVAEYRFDVWTADSGLPQNSVRAIVQTRDGYIWVGTLDGLARFDGVRFTVFNKANSPGLSGNRVTALYEDFDGDLWVGLDAGGVARYRSAGSPHWVREKD